MKHIRIGLSAIALIIALCLTGCSSSRKASSESAMSARAHSTATNAWSNVYMPVRVSAEQPMSMSFAGRATMIRDSVINISMRFLGMEVAVMRVADDSLFVIDKYHKYMFAEPMADILGERYRYLTTADIQNIILGVSPAPESPTFILNVAGETDTPAGQAATSVTATVEAPKAEMRGTLDWNFKDARWDNPELTDNFKRPSGYRRITLEHLLTSLKNFSM